MNKTRNMTLLTARVLLALIFVAAGANKIVDYVGTQAYMQSMGVPGVLLPMVITLELGGGLAVIVGLWTRPLCWLLAGFTLLAATFFHHNFADQVQLLMFMKNLSIAGGLLALTAAGAGAYGLDARH
jgi:putative oxidoreductase